MPEDARLQALIALHTPLPKRKSNDGGILPALVKRAAELGAKLWRNNVGTLQDRYGNYVSYGLCIGSSDLIGYTKHKITQDDVGKTYCIFTAIEAKSSTGRASPAQSRFIESVSRDGCISGIARSADDAEEIIKNLVRLPAQK